MFNNLPKSDVRRFELTIWHHKLDEESLEDLQVEVKCKVSDIEGNYGLSESINCYLILEAFGDITNYDEDYKEGLVYKTTLDMKVTYYTNYCGEGDEDVDATIKSHEIVSSNVDRWYNDNCKDN